MKNYKVLFSAVYIFALRAAALVSVKLMSKNNLYLERQQDLQSEN